MCSNKKNEVKCAISARDDNHAHFQVSHPSRCLVRYCILCSKSSSHRPGEKRIGCNSQVGELPQALVQYHYSFGYLSCQYSFWLFGFLQKLFPSRRSMVCVCKLIEKKSKKKKKKKRRIRMVPKTMVHFFFYFAGGQFFYF